MKPPTGKIRYRSLSATDLLGFQAFSSNDRMLKRTRQQQYNESFSDMLKHYRGVILVIFVPLFLICFILLLMPMTRSSSDNVYPSNRKFLPHYDSTVPSLKTYAVVFDAGSSGSRVHVFCFDQNLDLMHIGNEFDVFVQLKPGLSAYAKDPKAAAQSLVPLLEKAENVVPNNMRKTTPVKVGATAGLRQLGSDASEKILQEVKDFLKVKSSLKSDDSWVTILDGNQEGAYQWVSINYLLKRLGKKYSETVGVVDLGGGSVQMAYAISEAEAAKAPKPANGDNTYVKEILLMGTKYYLYVHSYLHHRLLAARAEILGTSKDSENPCILPDYNGVYSYKGCDYKVSSSSSGSNMNKCREKALNALKVNESSCSHNKCTFDGVWNGGGSDGGKTMFVASFFYDRAAEAGLIDASKPTAKVHPIDFQEAAERVCATKLEDAKSMYPNVDASNLPYLCMDLMYEFTLLVDGFGLDLWQEITLVKKVEYQNSLVEAAWPLGSAIEAVSAGG